MKFRYFAINYFSLVYIMIGYSFLIPFLPSLEERLGISVATTGLLISGYALGQFLFSPFAGEILSKYNKKNVLAISLFVYSILNFLTYFSNSFTMIFIFRFLTGIFAAGVFPAAETYVALETNRTMPKSVTKIAIYLSSATSVGMVIGPFMGIVVLKYDSVISFMSFFTLLGLVLSFLIFKVLLPSQKTSSNVSKSLLKSTIVELFKLFKDRINRFLMLGFLVFGITCSGIEAYGLRYIIEMGYLKKPLPFLEIILLLTIVIMYFLKFSNQIEKNIPIIVQLKYTTFLAALLLLIGSIFSTVSIFVLTFGLAFLFLSLFASLLVTYITKETTHPARLLANKNSLTCIGMVFGPIIIGFFYQVDVKIMFVPIIIFLLIVGFYSLFVKKY